MHLKTTECQAYAFSSISLATFFYYVYVSINITFLCFNVFYSFLNVLHDLKCDD